MRNLLRRMNVKVVCTTDDPLDSLEHHQKLKEEGFDIRILPAFRPDKAMNVDNAEAFNAYLSQLEVVSNVSIHGFEDYLAALKSRHDFFASMGCSVSDHGLEQIYAEDYTQSEIEKIFSNIRFGRELSGEERRKFKSAMLVSLPSGIMKKAGCSNTTWVLFATIIPVCLSSWAPIPAGIPLAIFHRVGRWPGS